jgi:hemerythrin superfamily protein
MAPASTHVTSSRRRSARSRPASRTETAITLLKADHKHVSELAERFEKARPAQKKQLAAEICRELTIHAEIEERIFYPAIREVADDELSHLLNEAEVEHQSVKDLISQIEAMLERPGDEAMLEARVTVLAEYVKHHVREEEREMFPLVRDTELDLKELGSRLAERRKELGRH